ncbi:unnamed protein product [Cuscuta epithymum]|uniref:Uncharacterized protein n=1 Tax=Cuscuta epithymum TaxID=186058 RepID=A0AAV0EF32_9ASTE|nr:unnamed protein product [Cuscuta epithymum]CAH9122631.1 unnamed protein product [Cuscuta epithymum]
MQTKAFAMKFVSGPLLGNATQLENGDCGYFQWYNDNHLHYDEYKMINKDTVIEKLLAEKKILEEKLQKLKNKKNKMSVVITEVEMMASKNPKGERYVLGS